MRFYIRRNIAIDKLFLAQDGMMFEGRFSEALSLVDAVMPDVVLAKQRQLKNKIAAEKLKLEQENQANQAENAPNNDEEMSTIVKEQSTTAPIDGATSSMTTTVVTAATSTTTIKQEPQANGETLNGTLLVYFFISCHPFSL